MAAPTATARQTPGGIPLRDGHPTFITFAADPDISLWEKSVTPPGIDGGDPVDTVTFHNDVWRTMASRSLKTLTEASFSAAYDPAIYTQILNICNVETSVTVTFSDGSTLAFWGYLQSFEADEITEGEQPTGTATIVATNTDPANGAEADPVLNSVTGT